VRKSDFNIKIPHFIKIRSVGVELHVDRRAAMTKLKVAFCNLTKAPEKDEEEIKRREGWEYEDERQMTETQMNVGMN
jgi:hypothetical protein